MIARSTPIKVGALLVTLGAHGVLLVGLVGPAPVQIAGALGGAEARLGTSFRDLVEGGVATPATVSQAESPTASKPNPLDAIEPMRSVAATPTPRTTPPIEATAASQSLAAQRVLPESPPATRAATRSTATPISPVVPEIANQAEGVLASPQAMTRTADEARREASSRATAPETSQPIEPDTVITAADDTATAPAISPRPPARPDDIAPPAPPAVAASQPARPNAEAPRTPTPQPTAAGNAPRNASAGTATGRENPPSASSGAGASQSAAGNAAVSNYPGEVMRCISRAGRPRVNARGTAVVSFRVSSEGRVGSVALRSSSGNAGLDRAAIRTISGAGPCARPPPGAQTAFSIRMQGR